jgi:hypothetical protein
MGALPLCVLALSLLQQPQAPRDAPKATPTGTASITGVVLLDADQPRPIRRARVTLNGPDWQLGRMVVTEDDGSFAFAGLPAGRYTLSASKDGYVTTAFGASRPGRTGTPVTVADGERRRVSMRLPRGAVITGTIQDVDGNPAQAMPVRALLHRQLAPAGNSALTDDRGVYRVYGLQAGDYTITASPRGTAFTATDIEVMTGDSLRAALDGLSGAASAQARPGVADQPSQATAAAPARLHGYTAVYYPGTTVITEAAAITLRKAEERSGIDFQVQLVPMARISGTIAVQDGALPSMSMINVIPRGAAGAAMTEGVRFSRAGPDGKFVFSGLPPGRYSVMARGSNTAAASDRQTTPPMWATADISLDGNDITDVALTLQPGYTLDGRLVFEGTRQPPAAVSRSRVSLLPVQGSGEMTMVPSPGTVEEQGQFTIGGIVPGRYRLSASLSATGAESAEWWLKSSVVNGVDLLDAPLDLRESISGAIVTFSDRPTEIAGMARDSAGAPSVDCHVIVAATDRSAWAPQSRRIVAVRPNPEGKFTVKNLPPGEYFIAAVVDVEQGEWFDPGFLNQLLPAAARVTLGEGERKTQDVAILLPGMSKGLGAGGGE